MTKFDVLEGLGSAQEVLEGTLVSMTAGTACGAQDPSKEKKDKPSACGSACGAKDPKKKPSACGSACGAQDPKKKGNKPSACGSACGAKDPKKTK